MNIKYVTDTLSVNKKQCAPPFWPNSPKLPYFRPIFTLFFKFSALRVHFLGGKTFKSQNRRVGNISKNLNFIYQWKGGVHNKPPYSRPPPLTCFFSIGKTLSVRYFLFTDNVSVRYFLFIDTLSVNNFFLHIKCY